MRAGALRTSIWGSTLFNYQPFKAVIDTLYGPPADGAANVVHAATVPWEKEYTYVGLIHGAA